MLAVRTVLECCCTAVQLNVRFGGGGGGGVMGLINSVPTVYHQRTV